MTPGYAIKKGVRYRYYISCVLAQGRKEEAGSIARVAAPEIEAVVLKTLQPLQEGLSEWSVRNLLSLAFLAPDIIKAAVERRLPRSFGVSRLVNLPIEWEEQMRHLGL